MALTTWFSVSEEIKVPQAIKVAPKRITPKYPANGGPQAKGWTEESNLDIPPGPCYTFRDPANNVLAIYENQRPGFMEAFKGRFDT